MNNGAMVEFRPHHFLCTVGFEGKGYSEEFVRGFQSIADRLRETPGGDDTVIQVTAATDSICEPCPNRQGKACTTEAKIQELDRGHARVLGIRAGQTLTWGEAKTRIIERMTDAEFDRVCAPCAWKPMGICARALDKLRKQKPISLITIALLLGALAAPHASHAAIVRERPSASSDDDASMRQRPLETVRSGLSKKHKSKPARALKKAWEALQAKKFPQAVSLATPVTNDNLFGDFANWLVSTAHYSAGLKALESKRNSEAVRSAQNAVAASFKIESRFPYSPMLKSLGRDIGLAEVLEGDAQASSKKWKLAQKAFEHGFQRLSASNGLGLVRPDSLARYAKACTSAKSEMCEAWIQRFGFFYPHQSEEMKAILKVIPTALEHPKPAYYGKFTQSYKAPDLDQASFEQNMALYLDGKFGAAIKGFQQFVDEFPKSAYRYRARYWLAQAMTHQQQHDKAQTAYESLQHDSPLTYYGLLAAFATGHNMDAPIEATMPLVAERDPLLQPAERVRVMRAEQFIAEGANELALMELKEVRARDGVSSPFLMYLAMLAHEAKAYQTTFNIMSDLVARGYEGATTGPFLGMIFPLEHLEEIRRQAKVYDLDPVLVLSLIKQESAFDKGAISSSGALGLMQLMPATATDTDPKIQRADLVEPGPNIRVGAKYLRYLMNRFNGNIVLSLAGYNAGPNAADRWVREAGGKRGMLDFIETIPYKETREYVSSIIRNYYWYSRKLTPTEPAKTLTYFWNPYAGKGVPTPSPTAPVSE